MSSATAGVGVDDLVTGEAVALDVPRAGIGMRVLSGLIDLVLGYLLYALGLWLAFRLAGGIDEAFSAAAAVLVGVLVLFLLPATLETLTRGKTVGKLITGLRTVRDDGGPIVFRHAATRALLGVVENYAFQGMPALMTAAFNGKGKRVGDLLAGTYVVRDRQAVRLPPPVPMPPPLEHWARTADLAPLPDRLAISLRQFVARAGTFTPATREELGRQLYAELLGYLAPAPPPGIHREYVMAAVLAERRERDARRLHRDETIRASVLPPDRVGPLGR